MTDCAGENRRTSLAGVPAGGFSPSTTLRSRRCLSNHSMRRPCQPGG